MTLKLIKQNNILPGNVMANSYLRECQPELGGTYTATSILSLSSFASFIPCPKPWEMLKLKIEIPPGSTTHANQSS